MRTLKCEKPATALGGEPASRTDQLGGRVNSENTLSQSPPQEFFAELTATAFRPLLKLGQRARTAVDPGQAAP